MANVRRPFAQAVHDTVHDTCCACCGRSGDDIHNLTKRVGESVKRRVMRKG